MRSETEIETKLKKRINELQAQLDRANKRGAYSEAYWYSEFRFKQGWIKALFWVLEYEMENETE
ncbi:MAG: hypothetical protein JRM72_08390 [Nitrososphaerota archaeon]|jgi:hypothetical protein|nr:hypothetical protein [Nitrososphaerota archaeon]